MTVPKFDMPARTDLPGKEIAESTYKAYKTELNRFARLGLSTREELLNHQDDVIKIIKESEFTNQQKKVQISAVLKVLGDVKGSVLSPLKEYLDSFFPAPGTMMANGTVWKKRQAIEEDSIESSDSD